MCMCMYNKNNNNNYNNSNNNNISRLCTLYIHYYYIDGASFAERSKGWLYKYITLRLQTTYPIYVSIISLLWRALCYYCMFLAWENEFTDGPG